MAAGVPRYVLTAHTWRLICGFCLTEMQSMFSNSENHFHRKQKANDEHFRYLWQVCTIGQPESTKGVVAPSSLSHEFPDNCLFCGAGIEYQTIM